MPIKACPKCKADFEFPEGKKRTYCRPCIKIINAGQYARDPEYNRQRAARHRAENPEMHKATTAIWRKNNADRFKVMVASWKDANKEHRAAYRREQHAKTKERANALARKWKSDNPEKCRELFMRRQATKMRAVPKWFDGKKAIAIYKECREISEKTGIKHHVDHIVPLQSKVVCGLHWHGNLQVLPAHENQSKLNRHCPDTPLAIGM